MGDRSFNERQRLVQAAAQKARGTSELYVAELYDDRAIIEAYGDSVDGGKSFEYPYTIAADDAVTLGDPREVVRETTYRAKAVKFVGADTIEGLAFPFDSHDTDGETFTKSTDLCLDWFPERPLLYHHGLDAGHAAVKVGRVPGAEFETREEGIWAQAQLDKNARYRKAIDVLIEKGALGYSSGAYAHLARKKSASGEITRWPWVELSLEPTPSHPGTLGVHYIKSASDLADLFDEVPPAVKAALAALDEWASDRDDDGLHAGLKFDDHGDRLLADVEEFRDRVTGLISLRAKAGRVLSASTRERLLRHPASLRELADDLDGLLSEADAEKAKTAGSDFLHDVAATLRRAALVDMPAEGVR